MSFMPVSHTQSLFSAQSRRRRATGGKPPRVSPKALYMHINVPPEILRARKCRTTYMTKPPTAHAVRIATRIRAKNYSCLTIAVISLTAVLILASLGICEDILEHACMIVVCSLPPKRLPIAV